jgi:protease-4
MIVALLLFLALAVSVLFNIGSVMSGVFRVAAPQSGYYLAQEYGPRLQEVVIENHFAGNKVAVIEIEGIITSDMLDRGAFSMVEVIKAQLRRAKQDSRVKAVILKVNSPGGEVLASDDIAKALADFQGESGKPVVASMGSLAASGGYYISAPCRWIVANELTLTGSIGVIMSSWNYRGLMNKVGVLPQVYKSGRFKDMLSGSREPSTITPEEQRMLQALIDQTYERFKEVVKTGREAAEAKNNGGGRKLRSDWEEYADGRVLSGKEAHELGFVDQLGSFEDAVTQAKSLAGISRANVVQYQQHYDLGDLFRLFGNSDADGKIKLDLGLTEPRVKAGHLYFLAPTFLN